MKISEFKFTALAILMASSSVSVLAAEASYQSEKTTNPIEAIVHIPVTGVRVAAGAAALPFMFIGEIGRISSQVGEELWMHASDSNSDSSQTTQVNN
jgi:hypothetical protein